MSGVDVGGDGEGEPRGHARRERPRRGVHEVLDLGPLDDALEAPPHVRAREAQERALEHDVLARGELAVEPQAELEDRRDPAGDVDPPFRGRQDAGDDAEEGALAGAVSADDADAFAGLHRRGPRP